MRKTILRKTDNLNKLQNIKRRRKQYNVGGVIKFELIQSLKIVGDLGIERKVLGESSSFHEHPIYVGRCIEYASRYGCYF
jgi:hypothetical protein